MHLMHVTVASVVLPVKQSRLYEPLGRFRKNYSQSHFIVLQTPSFQILDQDATRTAPT